MRRSMPWLWAAVAVAVFATIASRGTAGELITPVVLTPKAVPHTADQRSEGLWRPARPPCALYHPGHGRSAHGILGRRTSRGPQARRGDRADHRFAQGKGEHVVTLRAKNALGTAAQWRIVVCAHIALTPPMGWNSWNCFADYGRRREGGVRPPTPWSPAA